MTRSRDRWVVMLLLALIVLMGLGLRLYRLDEESVDHEEFISVSHLDAPGLIPFVRDASRHYPFSVPLPFVFEYLWSRMFGRDIYHVRLLFVCVGLLCIPLLYSLTRYFYQGSPWASAAGLVAAFFFALSPVHVFHATEARQYPFLVLFGLLSLHTFLKLQREPDRRWLAANLLVNLCVVWTHIFGILILAVEGLFLLTLGRGGRKQALLWGAVQAILCVPWAIWVLSIDVPPSDNIYASYVGVPTETLLLDAFADDVLFIHKYYPAPASRAWQNAGPETARYISDLRPWFGGALLGLLIAPVLWTLYATARQLLASSRALRSHTLLFRPGTLNPEPEATSPPVTASPPQDHMNPPEVLSGPTPREFLLLLAWLLVPVLVLGIVSNTIKPCYANRYTMYSSLAIYVLLGGMLASLPRLWITVGVTALGAVLYAYQLSLYLPGPIRTDWNSVSALIAREGSPRDFVLVEDPFWRPEFEFNDRRDDLFVSDAYGRDTLCGLADWITSHRHLIPKPGGIWILLVDTARKGGEDLEQCLQARNFTFKRTHFPGERPVIAYHLDPPLDPISEVRIEPPPDARLAGLIERLARTPAHPALNEFLDRIRYIPDRQGGAHARLAFVLAKKDARPLAARLLSHALEMNPDLIAWLSDLQQELDQAPTPPGQ
jgi:hypothetical protein